MSAVVARFAAFLGGSILAVAGCDASGNPEAVPASARPSVAAATVAEEPAAEPAHPLGSPAAWRACEEKRRAARAVAAAPGNPGFEADRAALIGRVRGATVLWKREPTEHGDAAEVIRELESAGRPLRAVRDAIHRHRRSPEQLRAIFLREGYFYVRGVDTAVAAVQQLGLGSLFRAPRLHLLRDGALEQLRRVGRRYVHEGGALDGEPAELLFADRVGEDRAALDEGPLAVDFSRLQEELGFDRLRVEHLSDAQLVGAVRYGDAERVWVPVLFDVRAASAALDCHAVPEPEAERVSVAYRETQRAREVQRRIRDAVSEQVRERLPFDAPRGGADPADKYPLRARWKDAYAKSRKSFRFGGKRYQVYDERGRPRPPQVCIDFVYDTWERASGTWYRPMKERAGAFEPAPQRVVGKLDLDALGLDNRRRVSRFLTFARAHPTTFDVWRVPEEDRVVFEKHALFFSSLLKHVDHIRRGDMLVVRRPKHGKLALHHTMIVMEVDPITGVPALLAGNASRPRVQTFEGVMQTSPRRYLAWRIRPRATWLDAAVLAHRGG